MIKRYWTHWGIPWVPVFKTDFLLLVVVFFCFFCFVFFWFLIMKWWLPWSKRQSFIHHIDSVFIKKSSRWRWLKPKFHPLLPSSNEGCGFPWHSKMLYFYPKIFLISGTRYYDVTEAQMLGLLVLYFVLKFTKYSSLSWKDWQ